jgi:hypothetical protein
VKPDARVIKTQDEVALLNHSAMMVTMIPILGRSLVSYAGTK